MTPKTVVEELIEETLKEFDKKSMKYVGDGGWCCITDNEFGLAIWPEQYDTIKDFISTLLQTARKDMVSEMEKMVDECVREFHGAVDITGIVDEHDLREKLQSLKNKYGTRS